MNITHLPCLQTLSLVFPANEGHFDVPVCWVIALSHTQTLRTDRWSQNACSRVCCHTNEAQNLSSSLTRMAVCERFHEGSLSIQAPAVSSSQILGFLFHACCCIRTLYACVYTYLLISRAEVSRRTQTLWGPSSSDDGMVSATCLFNYRRNPRLSWAEFHSPSSKLCK